MSDIVFRPAEKSDYAKLGVVGPAAYSSAYHHMWPEPADLVRHLMTFDAPWYEMFAATPGHYLYLAEQGGFPLGFLTMVFGSLDPIHEEAGGAEIPRIFLLPNACGRGVGRGLFRLAEATARAEGLGYVWLDAMDSADWAIRSYLGWGFREIGTTIFPRPVAPEFEKVTVFKKRLSEG